MGLLAPNLTFLVKKFQTKTRFTDSQMFKMGSIMPPVWCVVIFVHESSAIIIGEREIAADRKLLKSIFKNAKFGLKISILHPRT